MRLPSVFAAVAFVVVPSCGPKDVPPTPPTIVATSTDSKACIALREHSCPEGLPKRGKCEDAFTQARTLHEADIDEVAKCILSKTDAAGIRTCGGPGTLTFPCPGGH